MGLKLKNVVEKSRILVRKGCLQDKSEQCKGILVVFDHIMALDCQAKVLGHRGPLNVFEQGKG